MRRSCEDCGEPAKYKTADGVWLCEGDFEALISRPAPGEFNGEIIESIHMVDGPFEDWSRVRSPGRARRRRAKHRQNIRLYYTPKPGFLKLPDGTMVGHPATVHAFRAKIRQGMERKSDEIARQAFYGA